MKIFLADKLSSSCVDALERGGHEVVSRPDAKGDALVEALRSENPAVLVVRSTKVPESLLDAAPALELVVRAGAGYDTIDVDAASSRGIFVSNCPGKNSVAVAELTLGLVMALDRRIPDNVADARGGTWNKAEYSKAPGLKGRTLGLVGLGSIGREVARRAEAFGMRVIGWSRSLTPESAAGMGVGFRATPIEVARDADIVSLHVAATADTKHLADRAFFEAMSPGALFINTTRSSVVDEEALVWAVENRGIRAGLDVFEDEPAAKDGTFRSAVASHPGIYVTHHIGASTEQAQESIAAEAARIILLFSETGDVVNCVNVADQTPATHKLTVRHLDRVGVLANVLGEIRTAGWNVQEMENMIFAGARAACASIRFDGDADPEVLARIGALPDVLAVSVIKL
jgi:D-3-phosphoglycerate dehydrogenase